MKPKLKILLNGTKQWCLNGKFHREDGPAIEYPNGSKYWFLNGKLHREDGPAVEQFNGIRTWYLNGECHREDGPAFEYKDGTQYWYLNKKLLFEEDLLSDKIKIDYPNLYNSYLIYQVMGS